MSDPFRNWKSAGRARLLAASLRPTGAAPVVILHNGRCLTLSRSTSTASPVPATVAAARGGHYAGASWGNHHVVEIVGPVLEEPHLGGARIPEDLGDARGGQNRAHDVTDGAMLSASWLSSSNRSLIATICSACWRGDNSVERYGAPARRGAGSALAWRCVSEQVGREFLRAHREATQPSHDHWLQQRRRTPGLRREEVAARAATSTDYYTRLER
jgi:hypothetical protein